MIRHIKDAAVPESQYTNVFFNKILVFPARYLNAKGQAYKRYPAKAEKREKSFV